MTAVEDAKRQAYKYLDTPLPLQLKEQVKAKSLFDFVIPEPGVLDWEVTETQEINKVNEQYYLSKKNTHHLGDSLCTLFKEPVYKSHQLINTADDYNFGSCKTTENFKLNAYHIDYPVQDDVLQFESCFESGNLAIASVSRLNNRMYYLALQRDINSKKITTQWFYFRVKNRQNTGTFTFNIVNYVKPFSMFRMGMKPCVYSVKSQKGWERAGNNIEYRPNSIYYDEQKNYYTFTFSYDFKHPDDEVFFAYCYPYTYTRLQNFLDDIEPKHTDKMRRKVLAKTHAGNVVELILITNPQIPHKRVLYLSARVHPGETVSSFACESIIKYLLSSHPQAEKLRNQFIIKIIPMLNPDGVIQGNYRASLSGDDLNRQWKQPDSNHHQEIYYSKKLITESEYKKLLYIDLHGHSKKRSSFMYGCTSQKSPYIAKELPYILSKKMQHFSYFSCNFTTPKSKEGTSRLTLWKSGIDFSYTYELSFCGPQKERRHFNIQDYETIGVELCIALSGYFCNRILSLEDDEEIKKHCEQFYDDQELMNMGNEQTNGSSSQLENQTVKDLSSPEPISKVSARRLLKRSPNTQKTENRETINSLLQSYLAKYQKMDFKEASSKIDESLLENFKDKKKIDIDRETFMRERQSFAATKVSLQQMALQDHLFSSMSSFYGLTAETKRSDSSAMPKTKSQSYSYSQPKGKDSLGLLLPNVQKGQYKRYDRYKKGRSVCQDRSVSFHVQSVVTNNVINQLNLTRNVRSKPEKPVKDISLVTRIRSRTKDKIDNKY